MVTARSERPRFFEGQYIGAADLSATVDYARELSREGALGGQSWGICIGLDLVEVPNASGGFDYFVLPGLAFDGYGRPIVVLAPAPVPASLFADFPTGNQSVWIRYDETQNRGLRPGWESCDAGDAYARVREGFVIEAGPMSAVKDRQSGVEIAGVQVQDARLALNSVDSDAPLICDASVPHQTFPADSARWLVPIGAASWTAGAPGSLGERSADAKKLSRTLRRYVGQVAESVYAADGVLRLRDRMTDRDASKTPDEQCVASSVRVEDLVNAVDPTDSSKTLDRLKGNELVWVEGHMRITGDARLWGTKLELRKTDGTDGTMPLHLARGATLNPDGGADLQVAIGAIADGKTRLIAGVAPAGAPFAPKLQLKNDGRLAVGTTIPADVKSHTILANTEGDTSSAIASALNKVAKLQFATGVTLTESAHLGFDDATKKLRLGNGTDLANFTYLSSAGKMGIKFDAPESLDADANDLVVKSTNNAGITLVSDPGTLNRINFCDNAADAARRHAGSLLYNHGVNRIEFWTASAPRVSISSAGDLGIGTLVPTSRLQIHSLFDARLLRLDGDRIQAENGGIASQLSLQANGGGTLFGGSLAASQQVSIGADGRIGLGTTAPGASIHIRNGAPAVQIDATGATNPRLQFLQGGFVRSSFELDTASLRTLLINTGDTSLVAEGDRIGINIGNTTPVTNLHVRGSIAGNAFNPEAHVALIENTAGGGADVLALKMGNPNPGGGNHFITFFGGNDMVGRIEGDAGGVTYESGAGDFAECLQRAAEHPAIGPGRIVGVHGGLISLVTAGADSLLVTSKRAALVGNVPRGGEEGWERVALVGQVPVTVEGPVAAGDYILPSGRNDGNGRAVAQHRLAPAEAPLVVGRAWEASSDAGPKPIRVAVGVAGTTAADAMASTLGDQADTIARLEAQLAALLARLEG